MAMVDLKKAFGQTVREIKREVNKKVLKVPEIEQKVLDATSNEPWGPHGTAMSDIAQATRNFTEHQMIMSVIWKRLSDKDKNWRHVYKGLTLLEFLVAQGAERVIDELRDSTYKLKTLVDFQYVESNGKDQGLNVRKKAQALLSLLADNDRIREVRVKAAANKDKYRGIASSGYGSPSNSYSSTSGAYSGDRFGDGDDKYGSDKYGSRGYSDSYRERDEGRYGDTDRDSDRFGSADRDRDGKYGSGGARSYSRKYEDTSDSAEDGRARDTDQEYDQYGQRSVGSSRYSDDRQPTLKDPSGVERSFENDSLSSSKEAGGLAAAISRAKESKGQGPVASTQVPPVDSLSAVEGDDCDDFNPRAASHPAGGEVANIFGEDFHLALAIVPPAAPAPPPPEALSSADYFSTSSGAGSFQADPAMAAAPMTSFQKPPPHPPPSFGAYGAAFAPGHNGSNFESFQSFETNSSNGINPSNGPGVAASNGYADPASTLVAFDPKPAASNMGTAPAPAPAPAAPPSFDNFGSSQFDSNFEATTSAPDETATNRGIQAAAAQSTPTIITVSAASVQPTLAKVASQSEKPRSKLWEDTLSLGIVDLNIKAKDDPLSSLGIELKETTLAASQRKQEEKPAVPAGMGRAMGSGSGMGMMGAQGIAPPSQLSLGSGMGMRGAPVPGPAAGFGMGPGIIMGYQGMGPSAPGMGAGYHGMGASMAPTMQRAPSYSQQPPQQGGFGGGY